MLETIAAEAAAESELWASCLRPSEERDLAPVFSPLAPDGLGLGVETIYEGYLVHYGRSRLFAAPDDDTALLLGDYLYAHGLVHVAASGDAGAVADLAELISLCAQLRADRLDGDGVAWAATAALLGTGTLGEARDALRLEGDVGPLGELALAAAGPAPLEVALRAHGRRAGR